MESVFQVIAEPNRRAILQALMTGDLSAGELERRLRRLSQPAVSKHLRVLRDSGLVDVRIEAQKRIYRLRPERLKPLDAWLEPYRRLWEKTFDALDRYLASVPDVAPETPETNPKKRKR
jgi:DNA-binding transcriptional ArsR family regulator